MSEASGTKVLRFVHRFSPTLSCEIQIPVNPPGPGEMFSPVCLWSGRSPKHVPAYRQWVLVTNQTLADRWGQRILYGLGIAPNRQRSGVSSRPARRSSWAKSTLGSPQGGVYDL